MGKYNIYIICKSEEIFNNKKKEINNNEFFSLKNTDSLYKRDIGKFLDTLSSHFI